MKHRKLISTGLGGLAFGLLAACGDSPVGPEVVKQMTPVPTTVELVAGANQSAQVGQPVAVPPTVLVKDNQGQPMAGVSVRFTVVTGGGSVGVSATATDASGQASAGRWTLGGEGLNEVEVSAGTLPTVRFSATAIAPAPPPTVAPPAPTPTGTYNITVRYVSSLTPRQQDAVTRAINTWQNAIRGDLSNIPLNAPANACFSGQPAVNQTVDDILIFVEFVAIDGVGKTLGEAGPCYVRNDNGLPVMGHLKLDSSDLQQMESIGTLDDVVLHEIGHILGIGTLWPSKGLLNGAGTTDPTFGGLAANAAYQALGGAGAVPVENTGGEGTREGHWRESRFGNELMTGWINASPNPLSRMTIASLQDLGYGANPGAAGSYTLGGTSGRARTGIDLAEHERIVRPRYMVDTRGRKTPLVY